MIPAMGQEHGSLARAVPPNPMAGRRKSLLARDGGILPFQNGNGFAKGVASLPPPWSGSIQVGETILPGGGSGQGWWFTSRPGATARREEGGTDPPLEAPSCHGFDELPNFSI
ncbi:MAG: hypothetical protein HQM03_06265 [Magnetococcales bacterium]|nr:hypothetical protein [Magnetococcales bacterium]